TQTEQPKRKILIRKLSKFNSERRVNVPTPGPFVQYTEELASYAHMDFDHHVTDFVYNSDPMEWNILNCLKYLEEHVQYTSDSKKDIVSAFVKTFKQISNSTALLPGVKKKAQKLCKNAEETFQRKEIDDFFKDLDHKFETSSFDNNGCELLKKSGDFNTLRLSSRYMKRSSEFLEEDESVSNQSNYFLRKRHDIDYNEERMIKKQHQDRYSTPSPCSPTLHSLPIDNPFVVEEDEDEDGPIIIDDFSDELSFENGDPENDLKIGEANVSQLFRQYQKESLKIAKTGGLLVESNVHEILSLSSIFLLVPGSHPNTMINIFSSPLLDEIHQQIIPTQQIELDSECESKFRKATKKAMKESRECAVDWLWSELSNDQTLKENLGIVFLECLKSLPITKIKNEPSEITLITNHLDYIIKGMLHNPDKHIVEWPNTGLDEIRQENYEEEANPDFTVSIIHQLQKNGVIFVGEVSPPSEKNNVYKNCNDLIRVGVFMKDCQDSTIDKGADIKILGFQCIEYTVDFYMMDLVQGMYAMIHIGQVSIPTFLKEISTFIEDMETLLEIHTTVTKAVHLGLDVFSE
ncbi:14905_t:CDS:2, partial [Acaulospora morrowiae]